MKHACPTSKWDPQALLNTRCVTVKRKDPQSPSSIQRQVIETLWARMPVSKANHAAFIDVMPYDGTIAHAVMEMKTLDGADLPTASCASVIWAGSTDDKSMMYKNMYQDVRDIIYKLSKDGGYAVPGLAGVPKELNTSGPRPTFKQEDFTVTHPMEDDTLPVRQSVRALVSSSQAPEPPKVNALEPLPASTSLNPSSLRSTTGGPTMRSTAPPSGR